MTRLIKARGLSKRYSNKLALKSVDFDIHQGKIVGLVGPNGAGKTTIIKAILGLTSFDGELEVLGMNPATERHQIMQNVSFIADVAVLPRWLKVSDALTFMQDVHPKFNLEKAKGFLQKTKIPMTAKVKELSKGMVAQLHLALVIAIDAKLLVLDEPTLGLDILYRKEFYNQLLSDYFDEGRSILVTTHQIEEIENLLTDLLFVRDGEIVLNSSMDEMSQKYSEVMVNLDQKQQAEALKPIAQREVFGRCVYLYDGVDKQALEMLGEVRSPSVADLFVAMMKEKQ